MGHARIGLCGVCVLAAMAGCSGRTRLLEPLTGPSSPRLTAADFRGAGAGSSMAGATTGASTDGSGASGSSGAAVPGTIGSIPTPTARAGIPPLPAAAANQPARVDPVTVEVVAGAPDLTGAVPPPIEGASLLDEKVGDINGRPIYASEFFEPIEAQLIATARDMRRADWVSGVREAIKRRLGTMIDDELLRAEALESLPKQAREVGLSTFLESRRANLQSEAGGSLTEAQKRLLDERGITVEQWLRELEDQELIRFSVRSLVQNIQISARDIQQYYDRNQAEFNPPPSARLLEIVVLSRSQDQVAQIEAALASGTAFADLAAGPMNTSRFRAQGGLRTFPLTGEYNQTNLFNNDALNEAAWRLQPGQWAGPIVYGPAGQLTAWVYLVGIERGGHTLYEVQTEIVNRLREQEWQTRRDELIARLRERASFTSEDEMVRRLLEIGIARYYPPGQAEPERPRTTPAPAPARRP